MQNYLIIWLGQMVSLIGSSMTAFAFAIWVWELTHQATALALFQVFAQIPQILITPIAGVLVDRINRKLLMIVGDTVGGIVTITVLLLYVTDHLQLWHLYITFAVKRTFEQFQELAYSASISTIVPKQQYSRASSLSFLASNGAIIIAPALAGVLYEIIGLVGILSIDIISFLFAIATVLGVHIPQLAIAQFNQKKSTHIIEDMSFGFKYIIKHPSLLTLLILTAIFWFIYDVGDSVYKPMILERSGNDASILGSLYAAVGVGGVLGVLLINIWGGSKSLIKGVLFGMIGTALGKIILGLGRTPVIWIPAQLCSSFNYPLLGSYVDAIWLAKVQPQLQGRVFATQSMILLLTSAIANLAGGTVADRIFEPAMMPGGSFAPLFGSIFGTEKGAGMALMYVISSLGLLLVGISGYVIRRIREIETILPDYEDVT
ncbi:MULTISPECIES: MFS transporter [unclassified Tolypothrix]|uniref:MFS transporter n=1 Tax=unclassified Tolypothrix TaxID=2649714 RepID=UPI0005EABFE3|nr:MULTISPECIES: MFS transporter [unclassified Tolypothrix]BAY91140.1 major facilitator transporter [Microchaete diplosiphon NIES-3275]EKE99932.1 transporter, major facilitator family protein [Tolypothrix sp. PCC 7601]MBE9081419.1 MFS transporter [Tolypothrix sp. LEGE 11397]UYD25230.1 MFS transporter [Tolypothrix sp. PCC 7712]UYD32531.1 MFS transporter [Tolypothrix sp. PCC 7601]